MEQEFKCNHCKHPAHCGHGCSDETCDHCPECACDYCQVENSAETGYN
jgi:hypothetical protein